MKISSEDDSKKHVLQIFSEGGIRQGCLTVFVEAISEANVYGRDKWAVTCNKEKGTNKVRLHAGHVIACTLEGGRIWMALDKELLKTSRRSSLLEQSDYWEWDNHIYPEYPSIQSRNGYYLPSESLGELWPEIKRLHFESIYQAVHKDTLRQATRNNHSSEVLRYLRNELGKHVPDPLY